MARSWRSQIADEVRACSMMKPRPMPAFCVCSAKPRPSVQKGAKGHQWWLRDVFHLRETPDANKTLCGRDCSEWLSMDSREKDEVKKDHHCCKRCVAILINSK